MAPKSFTSSHASIRQPVQVQTDFLKLSKMPNFSRDFRVCVRDTFQIHTNLGRAYSLRVKLLIYDASLNESLPLQLNGTPHLSDSVSVSVPDCLPAVQEKNSFLFRNNYGRRSLKMSVHRLKFRRFPMAYIPLHWSNTDEPHRYKH